MDQKHNQPWKQIIHDRIECANSNRANELAERSRVREWRAYMYACGHLV